MGNFSLNNDEARISKSKEKNKLICFFGIKGIIHYKCIPQNQTDNQAFTLKLWKVWGSTFVEKGQIFGWLSGFRIMKMCRPTQHFA